MVVTPTFPLLDVKALPALVDLLSGRLGVGRYVSSPTRKFIFSDEGARRTFGDRYDPYIQTRVLFGYAADSESLESATAKAAWLDEAGQKKFRVASWQAIRRRLSIAQGRILITTSLYNLGWLKDKVFDRYRAGDKEIEVVVFDSTENPSFPVEEFERARRDMPAWQFNMMYRAKFETPPGLIYDCVDASVQKIPRIVIPATWRRYIGLDFGEVNMAASFWAEQPETRHLYCYRTYHEKRSSVSSHVRAMLHGELAALAYCVGGSKSENEWRDEFKGAGLPVRKPKISDVEVGISAAYAVWQKREAFAFDDLDEFWDELSTYSRAVDESGNVRMEIEDKEQYHLLDTMRYLLSDIRATRSALPSAGQIVVVARDPLAAIDAAKSW